MTESEPYPLSTGEQKLVNDLRQLSRHSKRPMTVTVVIQDGIWHFYHGQAQGAVKSGDRKHVDN